MKFISNVFQVFCSFSIRDELLFLSVSIIVVCSTATVNVCPDTCRLSA